MSAHRSKIQNAEHPVQQLQDVEVQVLRAREGVQVREKLHVRARERGAAAAVRGIAGGHSEQPGVYESECVPAAARSSATLRAQVLAAPGERRRD